MPCVLCLTGSDDMAATFKVELIRDFTVMSNHHLRNKNLSLKAKGLHSLMLSLPESWDYTINGLVTLSKDGRDSVISALKELEKEGYLIRRRNRNEKGQLTDTEYIIFQQPVTDFPTQDKPIQGKPMQENHLQSNTNISNTNFINNPSINQSDVTDRLNRKNVEYGNVCGKPVENYVENYEEAIKDRIHYLDLCERYGESSINNIVSVMNDVYVATDDIRIGKWKIPCETVKAVYNKIDYDCVIYIMDSLSEASKKRKIRNMKKYLMTTLYNAPMTMDIHYRTDVNYDLSNNV